MNSSISTSDAAWSRTLRRYAAACVLLAGIAATLLIGLDPYDTGRFQLFRSFGVPLFGQRLTGASLARNPSVEAAIIGNSTVQLLDPARLTEMTALKFVSLAVPGTGPLEQLAIGEWFLHQHRAVDGKPAKAVVVGLDQSWCRADGRLDIANPFPFWLYGDGALDYVRNMMRLKTFEAIARKLKVMIGRDAPLRADGYRDYDTGHHWDAAEVAARLAEIPEPAPMPDRVTFAAAPLLVDWLQALPPGATAVLVFVPRHHNALPAPGSHGERLLALCKAAYRGLAAARPHTIVLDWLVGNELSRDDRGFWDLVHFRQPIARLLEGSIAAAIRGEPAE